MGQPAARPQRGCGEGWLVDGACKAPRGHTGQDAHGTGPGHAAIRPGTAIPPGHDQRLTQPVERPVQRAQQRGPARTRHGGRGAAPFVGVVQQVCPVLTHRPPHTLDRRQVRAARTSRPCGGQALGHGKAGRRVGAPGGADQDGQPVRFCQNRGDAGFLPGADVQNRNYETRYGKRGSFTPFAGMAYSTAFNCIASSV